MKIVQTFGPNGKWGTLFRLDDGSLIFRAYRNREKHFMRKHQSWALSDGTIEGLRDAKCDIIKLIVEGEGVYETTLRAFDTYGIPDQYGGDEPQIHLEEKYWTRVG